MARPTGAKTQAHQSVAFQRRLWTGWLMAAGVSVSDVAALLDTSDQAVRRWARHPDSVAAQMRIFARMESEVARMAVCGEVDQVLAYFKGERGRAVARVEAARRSVSPEKD